MQINEIYNEYIGSEISSEYCEIIKKRLEQIPLKLDL